MFVPKLRMLHRCWRLRFRSEVSSIRYLRNGNFRGTTLIDIGANKGVYSIYMARAAGKDGNVIAFEAQPELGDRLREVKRMFSLDNLEIENVGLSSAVGNKTMYRKRVGAGGASFHAPGNIDNMDVLETSVTTLDTFLAGRDDVISFIKADVEGHEHDVFVGAEKTLKRHMPTLLFESDSAVAAKGDLFRFLVDLGYDGCFFYVRPEDHESLLRRGRGRWVHYSEYANYGYTRPTVSHRNYVFVPKEAFPRAEISC